MRSLSTFSSETQGSLSGVLERDNTVRLGNYGRHAKNQKDWQIPGQIPNLYRIIFLEDCALTLKFTRF